MRSQKVVGMHVLMRNLLCLGPNRCENLQLEDVVGFEYKVSMCAMRTFNAFNIYRRLKLYLIVCTKVALLKAHH